MVKKSELDAWSKRNFVNRVCYFLGFTGSCIMAAFTILEGYNIFSLMFVALSAISLMSFIEEAGKSTVIMILKNLDQ